jgi:hypothetical protein
MVSLYFSMLLFLVVYNYVYVYTGISVLHILNARSSMDDKQQVLAIGARGWERLGLAQQDEPFASCRQK